MKDKKEKTRFFPVWKELVQVASEWEYATFHSHEEIAEILDVPPQTAKYYGYVNKARRWLIETGKLLETCTNRGYFVTEVQRYNEVTFEDIKKSKKYLELSILKSTFAPVERMDENTKKRHDVFLIKQVGLLNMTSPIYTEITKVVAPVNSRFQIKEKKPDTKVKEDEVD